MAPAYIIVDMLISDMEQYKQYMAAAPAAVAAFGGEYLVRGGRFETIEGNWQPARIAMLRFPSFDQPKPSTTARCTARRVPNGLAPPNSST